MEESEAVGEFLPPSLPPSSLPPTLPPHPSIPPSLLPPPSSLHPSIPPSLHPPSLLMVSSSRLPAAALQSRFHAVCQSHPPEALRGIKDFLNVGSGFREGQATTFSSKPVIEGGGGGGGERTRSCAMQLAIIADSVDLYCANFHIILCTMIFDNWEASECWSCTCQACSCGRKHCKNGLCPILSVPYMYMYMHLQIPP